MDTYTSFDEATKMWITSLSFTHARWGIQNKLVATEYEPTDEEVTNWFKQFKKDCA